MLWKLSEPKLHKGCIEQQEMRAWRPSCPCHEKQSHRTALLTERGMCTLIHHRDAFQNAPRSFLYAHTGWHWAIKNVCLQVRICVTRKSPRQGTTRWPGLAALRGMWHRLCRLQSVAPGTLCAFRFLGDQYTPSGSETFRLLFVSLYVPLEDKEAWTLNRTVGLRH